MYLFRRADDVLPVLIFSKTYCPYSKKAKGILLDKYTIDPPPYVVELDEHPLGAAIQDRLAVLTGRRTVPNIMVNGKSIGGGDDITALDNEKKLISTIKEYGGKGVSMAERFADSGKGL
jgi:glutaredoxin